MDIRTSQITIFLIVWQCFDQYLTENCLQIFTVNLTLEESKVRCQEEEGRHLTVNDILMNEVFKNQSRDFVSETRQSVWIDSENGTCRAFSWNVKVTISNPLTCSDKMYPACIYDADKRLCIKESLDDNDINSNDSFKTILIASCCGGAASLICITICVCQCVKAKKTRRKSESHEATSFELKRYRISEGFNTPVITDDEIKGSETAEANEMPYYILEKIDGSEIDSNLKRTNDWVEEQTCSLDEIDNTKICRHLAPSGPSEDGSDSFYRSDIIVAGNLSINNDIGIVRD